MMQVANQLSWLFLSFIFYEKMALHYAVLVIFLNIQELPEIYIHDLHLPNHIQNAA